MILYKLTTTDVHIILMSMWCEITYHISSGYNTDFSFQSNSKNLDPSYKIGSRSLGVFRKGKTPIIAEGKTPSYSRINMVTLHTLGRLIWKNAGMLALASMIHEEILQWKLKALISIHSCAGWFESQLFQHTVRDSLTCPGSFTIFLEMSHCGLLDFS